MGRIAPDRIIGVHVNGLVTFPSEDPADFAGLTGAEQVRLERLQRFRDDKMGFNIIQSTRPDTVGYGLNDSPAGQLAWIVEKFKEWTDTAAKELPEDAVDRDTLLTNVSVYWFTATAGSSAHLYYEMAHDPAARAPRATWHRPHRRGGRTRRPTSPSAASPSGTTTWSAGPSSTAGATSSPWSSRSCSPRTYASSSRTSADACPCEGRTRWGGGGRRHLRAVQPPVSASARCARPGVGSRYTRWIDG